MTTAIEDALRAVLTAHGIHQHRIVTGGKHRRLYFTVNGRETFYVYSVNPGSYRTIPNAVSSLRGLLRAAGASIQAPRKTATDKPRQPRPTPPSPALRPPVLPPVAPKDHPFARLASLLPMGGHHAA